MGHCCRRPGDSGKDAEWRDQNYCSRRAREVGAVNYLFYRPQVMAGAIFWVVVLGTIATLVLLGVDALSLLPPWVGAAVFTYLLYACLATRGLHRESQRVEEALAQGDLEEARRLLARIVGRETDRLTPKEIRRAGT